MGGTGDGTKFGLPRWQFTLSATTANIEAIRLARFATGRGVIVMFEGHYHGHDEEWLFEREKERSVRSTTESTAPGRATSA